MDCEYGHAPFLVCVLKNSLSVNMAINHCQSVNVIVIHLKFDKVVIQLFFPGPILIFYVKDPMVG